MNLARQMGTETVGFEREGRHGERNSDFKMVLGQRARPKLWDESKPVLSFGGMPLIRVPSCPSAQKFDAKRSTSTLLLLLRVDGSVL